MTHSGYFIRAREEDPEGRAEGRVPSAPSGEEVRDFYRSLFEDDDDGGVKDAAEERRERRRGRAGRSEWSVVTLRRREADVCNGAGVAGAPAPPAGRAQGYRLLRCAAQGDAPGVEELLRRGCDVGSRDEFGWSALMSAAYAGATHTALLLLRRGAPWRHVTDTQGRDARDLARLAGHHDVVRLLEQFSVTQNSHTSHTPADQAHSSRPAQWCDVCEVCYTDSARTHTSSTLHQFSLKRPPGPRHYCLTPSSVSYRLMLRLGWDPHSGLGPRHSGRLAPVGTALKSDTAGLGFRPAPRSKVTHFKANDARAVGRAAKRRAEVRGRGTTGGAAETRRTEERRRQWERDYRASFNSHA